MEPAAQNHHQASAHTDQDICLMLRQVLSIARCKILCNGTLQLLAEASVKQHAGL